MVLGRTKLASAELFTNKEALKFSRLISVN